MLEWRRRVLATVRSRRFSAASATQGGFFELRSDQISPGALSRYLDDVERTAETRKRPGFLGMWKTELGGSVQTVHHLYHWNSYTERDEARELTSDETDFHKGISHTETLANMTLPLPMLRESICDSKSLIMNEALPCLQMAGLPGALGFMPPSAVVQPEGASLVAYEMRTYQLQLGYSTVPKFLELYGEGLKDKLAADDSGASELCTLLYTDCGPLNLVIELWRHESLERSMASRQASRKATKWRHAVEQIAGLAHTFDTQMLRPLPSSLWL